MAKYIVTCTPPTPNGDLHLGHLSGPFLSADVCKRMLEQNGHDVLMVSYSDDYQSYLPRKAEAIERNPYEYAALMRRSILLSAELANINFDIFPSVYGNKYFKDSVEHYLDRISHHVQEEFVNVFKCLNCEKFGHEAFGRGKCNFCNASSDASQCENCAEKPIVEKMQDMHCVSCGTEMHLVKQQAMVWKLGKNYSKIDEYHKCNGMRHNLRSYLAKTLVNNDDSWPITRPGDSGLPMPRFSGDPVHTWFMGLSGYRAAVQEYLEKFPERGDFSSWWASDTHLVHFLGLDCSYSHAISYCAQLLCDPSGPPIGHFLTNLFLKLDGDDFSTSRGHAVWIKDITGQFPSDAIRFFTALHAPETEHKNFSKFEFENWVKHEYKPLVKFLENISQVENSCNGQFHEAYWDNSNAIKSYEQAIKLDAFSMSQMAKSLIKLIDEIKMAPSDVQNEGWCRFAQLCKPIMPNLSQKIFEGYNNEHI